MEIKVILAHTFITQGLRLNVPQKQRSFLVLPGELTWLPECSHAKVDPALERVLSSQPACPPVTLIFIVVIPSLHLSAPRYSCSATCTLYVHGCGQAWSLTETQRVNQCLRERERKKGGERRREKGREGEKEQKKKAFFAVASLKTLPAAANPTGFEEESKPALGLCEWAVWRKLPGLPSKLGAALDVQNIPGLTGTCFLAI